MDEDDAAIAVQPALPAFELPDFEGLKPTGVVTKLNGAGQRIIRAMHLDESIVLLVEARVSNVGHLKTDGGVHRVHTLKVDDLYEVAGKPGRRLLNLARSAYRTADDQRNGRAPLPLEKTGIVLGPDGYTDGNGNLLSDEDLAEIRGDQFLAAAGDESLDPVAVIFADGTRRAWPDDFDPGTQRPLAGEVIDDLQVREILDAVTGETLAEWTDAQEDERLAFLEEAARAEEAAGNAEAVGELEEARTSRVIVAAEHVDPGEAGCRHCSRQLGRMHLKVCPVAEPLVGFPSADGGEHQGGDEVEPFEGYESLGARDVVARVKELGDRDAVFAVASWEEDHGGRPSVLQACARRGAELMDGAR